jgi:RNA polymerase sigma-B factor
MATESGLTEDAVDEALEFARISDPRSLDASFNGDYGEEGSALVEVLGSEEPAFSASLDRMVLQAAMDRLPLREKTIIAMKFYRGLSQRQIASRINVSQMHVSRLERRALAKMKDIVAGQKVESIGMDREEAALLAAS